MNKIILSLYIHFIYIMDRKTLEMCDKFIDNQTRNPKTGRKIKMNGPTHKKLMKECNKAIAIEKERRSKPGRKQKSPKKVVLKPKKGRKQTAPKKFVPKPKRKIVRKPKKASTGLKLNVPKEMLDKIKKASDCMAWNKNPLKNPKTNRKIKMNGPTYKKLAKMCKKDVKVQKSVKLIDTSIRKIVDTYRKQSPDLIIKRGTKRVKDDKVRMQGGVKLTEMMMILYLLRKHKRSINMLLRKDFKELFSKINTNKLSINTLRSLDYLTIVQVDPYSNNPTKIIFPYTDSGMDQYFWTLNNPETKESKNRFTFFLMSIQSDAIKDDWGHPDKAGWGHFNFMVYDQEENTVYRFEPNGGVVNFYNSPALDIMLAKKFKSWGGIDYKTMNDFCPAPGFRVKRADKTRGPQALEDRKETQLSDPGGFCAYWSIFFIDFIMTNHKRPGFEKKTIPEHLNNMINDISKKFGSYKEFIRTFAVFINTAARNIGQNKDIDKYIDGIIKDI